MSNRRRPRRIVPIHPSDAVEPRQPVPFGLQHIEWTDQPAAVYAAHTLEWIAERRHEAMRLNAWRCEDCGLPFIAYDRHPGVTPMLAGHQSFDPDSTCTGTCSSVFYTRAEITRAAIDLGQGGQRIQPSHEWYRPSANELRSATHEVRRHVHQGGLLLRTARS